MKHRTLHIVTFLITVMAFYPAYAEEHHQTGGDAPVVVTQKVSDNIYMFQGRGGNVALFFGEDGAFLIDNDFAELSPAILEAVRGVYDKEIRFVFNTHWHGDHTGGNELLGEQGAIIVAHDNVRKRLSEENYIAAFDMRSQPAPKTALPELTYDGSATFHLNGEQAHVMHVANAHTDGDSIVHFPKSNVIHLGDIYFNGFYPFIDASTGGRLDGVIAAVELVLGMVDDETVIIPGHGALSNKAQLQGYRDMLFGVRDVLSPMIDAGKTLEQIAEENPLAPFNEKWGGGFLPSEKWLPIVHASMVK